MEHQTKVAIHEALNVIEAMALQAPPFANARIQKMIKQIREDIDREKTDGL